jgi:glyoxylase-like metal-dependent hydrolase (beta-lactamase superfamily II)
MPAHATIGETNVLHYPWQSPPRAGEVITLRPGLLWIRMELPFRLNHVNIYLLEGHDGWTMIDAGFGNETTAAVWEELFAGPLAAVKVARLLVTHAHPDHVGMAGWMVRRFGCTLWMTREEYLQAAYRLDLEKNDRQAEQRMFFRRHGMDETMTDQLLGRGQDYLKNVSSLPPSYVRLVAGDEIEIGPRRFNIITGGGHAFDQVMLHCPDDRLFLSADQILSKISPNISVWAVEPHADPLGEYLRSLHDVAATIPDDVLVLPGHGLPFIGLKQRIDQLIHHHQTRCMMIEQSCQRSPKAAVELVSTVFDRPLEDAHQMGFAAGEVVAHINYLVRRKRLAAIDDGTTLRFATRNA